MCPPLARRINRFTLAVRYPGFRSDPLTPLKISKANLIRRTSETCRFNPSEKQRCISRKWEGFHHGVQDLSRELLLPPIVGRPACVIHRMSPQFSGGHRFRGCGKTHECRHRRGRAALQGRVSRYECVRALAPVVAFSPQIEFFRSLFSRAVKSLKSNRALARGLTFLSP